MKKNLPILLALAALVVFGLVRYEHFGSAYNITSFWRYNSMFALISVGMAFVIITGGIDLSVGAVAALASVIAALTSVYGGWVAVLAGCAAYGLHWVYRKYLRPESAIHEAPART